jgi:hypothetical protein
MEVLEQSERFCELLCLIMTGKVRQTAKEKRKEQLNSRKGIVRSGMINIFADFNQFFCRKIGILGNYLNKVGIVKPTLGQDNPLFDSFAFWLGLIINKRVAYNVRS